MFNLFKKFPFYNQLSSSDCGNACLKMICKFYKRNISYKELDNGVFYKDGLSLNQLKLTAERLGFNAIAIKTTLEDLEDKAPLPAILHWKQSHYVVVYKIEKDTVYVADPAHGLIEYTREEFLKVWFSIEVTDESIEGLALLLEPKEDFYEAQGEAKKRPSIGFIKNYFLYYKGHIFQLLIGLLVGSIIQFLFPFLTRSIVDYGIVNGSMGFLLFVLVLQLTLFLLSIGIEFLRSRILLNISSRVNIFIISDFLIKVMKLPLSFFSPKMTGDLIQRIRDHRRVEQFISGYLLNCIFAIFNIIVFSIVLYIFSPIICGITLVSVVLEMAWIFYFLKKVEDLDHKNFAINAEDQNKVFELITGIQDIKLNNIEDKKRWEWEKIQTSLFGVSLERLHLNQIQEGGQRFFSYAQMILITFVAAMQTLYGDITLGTMLAILFIVGQLGLPMGQIINFVLRGQLAKLSLERLGEVHVSKEEEDKEGLNKAALSFDKSISIENLSFSYNQSDLSLVLKNISLEIPQNKVTAIVGTSGSGKTTLLKLLLKFYDPTRGKICVGDADLEDINSSFWRGNCGVVMQDSFIFSDTIENNIAIIEQDNHSVDKEKLLEACRVANILEFINTLPLGFNTKIGQHGIGLSQGQKQRLLIARAVYKNPEYLFFDEATNALDAENEKIIVNNLDKFNRGKTVIVVAHRLSTVKNADQIIVLDNGRIVEAGSHKNLITQRTKYFSLIKNQLELGA